MNGNAYELIALAMRYFFAAMMVLIVLRAGRGALVDSRRAARLRRLSPSTGITGELIVTVGDGRIRRGMRYPVIQEGVIGSSRKADISIRHPAVRRRHAYFQLTEKGLRIRGHAGARLYVVQHTPVHEIRLGDGGAFAIGPIRFLLVLSDGRSQEDAMFAPHSPAVHSRDAEEPRAEDPDAPFRRPEAHSEPNENLPRGEDAPFRSRYPQDDSQYDESDLRYDDSQYDDSDLQYDDDSQHFDDTDDEFFTAHDDRKPFASRPAQRSSARRRRWDF